MLKRVKVAGSGIADATTMLSRPTGFGQQGAAGFDRLTSRLSIRSVACEFDTVTKLPNVFGTVPDTVNLAFPASRPVRVYGIGVVLE
jgi:hypothetical protein